MSCDAGSGRQCPGWGGSGESIASFSSLSFISYLTSTLYHQNNFPQRRPTSKKLQCVWSSPCFCPVHFCVVGSWIQRGTLCPYSVKEKQVSWQSPAAPPGLRVHLCVKNMTVILKVWACSPGAKWPHCLSGFLVCSGPDIYASAPLNLLHFQI